MTIEIVRRQSIDRSIPVRMLDVHQVDRFDDVYLLLRDAAPQWQVAVDWGEHIHVPFREEVVWESAGVVVIGGGAAVNFLDLASGTTRLRVDLPCLFGHLALDHGEPPVRDKVLYILGWTDIIAIAPTLNTCWWTRNIAVDGVTFHEAAGSVVRFGVEMDPPGGWFEVEVDASTGRELSRKPAFTDDYAGIYGIGGKIS